MNGLINGGIEAVGSLLLAYNCWLLRQHKQVQGVSVVTTGFFTLWGIWNIYFYPANGLWWSLAGGICLAAANLSWLVMAVIYSHKPAVIPASPADVNSPPATGRLSNRKKRIADTIADGIAIQHRIKAEPSLKPIGRGSYRSDLVDEVDAIKKTKNVRGTAIDRL